MAKTVLGIFENVDEAQQAADELVGVGFTRSEIRLISKQRGNSEDLDAAGLSGALMNAGVPEDEAAQYTEGVRRGGTLVTVVAPDDQRASDAADVLSGYGAYDIEERATQWAAGHADGVDNAGRSSGQPER
jgi:hypothetical protein